jgi:hypothetical protein
MQHKSILNAWYWLLTNAGSDGKQSSHIFVNSLSASTAWNCQRLPREANAGTCDMAEEWVW